MISDDIGSYIEVHCLDVSDACILILVNCYLEARLSNVSHQSVIGVDPSNVPRTVPSVGRFK